MKETKQQTIERLEKQINGMYSQYALDNKLKPLQEQVINLERIKQDYDYLRGLYNSLVVVLNRVLPIETEALDILQKVKEKYGRVDFDNMYPDRF